MDGIQAKVFKARRHPATSWANAARTAYTVGQLILRKISKVCATHIKAKMHQILSLLGLYPRLCWGCLQVLTQTP